MSKINLVVLGGNLTRDPELKYTPQGTALCEFTIANSKKWKTQGGEWQEKPGFYNCICWGKRGEVISQHFSKGKPIEVRGELEFQQWETKDGNKRNAVKINVQEFFFVGAREANAPDGSADVNEEEIPF
jgi:single-strand DNA-binding protein